MPTTTQSFDDELRLGLAMNGGIALVLYQAGVVHEILDLVRQIGTYTDVVAATHVTPVLDIISGASAGGIAAVMAGHTLATNSTFDAFHKVWIVDADIAKMRYPSGSEPKSLLSTTDLISSVKRVFLDQKGKATSGTTPINDPVDIELRLCRTDFYGHWMQSTDALGAKIEVQSQASVVGFDGEDFMTWVDPGTTSVDIDGTKIDRLDRLIAAALETSAFPSAWPAVQDPITRRWYMDGGLWNNSPLDIAVNSVKDKPAFGKTHRAIVLVQPEPVIQQDQDIAPQPTVFQEIASAPVVGLNGNLWPGIEGILELNQRADVFKLLIAMPKSASYLEDIGCEQKVKSVEQLAEVSPRKNVEPTLLNLVRIQRMFLDDDPWMVGRWDALIQRKNPSAATILDHALEGLNVTGWVDLQLRAVRRQLTEFNQKIKNEDLKPEDITEKATLYSRIEVYKKFLYCTREESISLINKVREVSSYREIPYTCSRFRMCTLDMLDALESSPEKASTITEDWLNEIRRITSINSIGLIIKDDGTVQAVKSIDVNSFKTIRLMKSVISDAKVPSVDDLMSSFSEDDPQCIDYGLHLIAGFSEYTSKNRIDLIRISPNDTNNLSLINRGGLDPNNPNACTLAKVKLAGEGLGHFQGFLQERWRRNDYIWARLDTAETLLRAMQKTAADINIEISDTDLQTWITDRQKEILVNERELHNIEVPNDPITDEVGPGFSQGNSKLIGFGLESIAQADEPRFSENINYLAITAIKLLKGDSKKPPAALTVVERILRITSYVAQFANLLVPVKKRTVMPVWILTGIIIISGCLLYGAGWLVASGSWKNVTHYGLLAVALSLGLITIGCVLAWEWFVAVPMAFSAAYSLAFYFSGEAFNTSQRLSQGFIAVWGFALFTAVVAVIKKRK